jgi:hypothetical protein
VGLPLAAALPVSFAHQPPYTPPHAQQFPADSASAFACAGRTRVRFCFMGSHRGLLPYSRVSII